ncbi:MAG: hypothetical protein GF353_15685 [Candidatus Lokiarchaeota archaeon]|nr:hypothetical protein [Candidatus Lokiarchaeota archaeon]
MIKYISIFMLAIFIISSCKQIDSDSPTGPTGPSDTTQINPPVANFDYAIQITDTTISTSFDNSSSNATAYLWSFGDGNYSTEDNPVHAYDSLGYYEVNLIAIGEGKDTIYKTILLDRKPKADFDATLSSNRGPASITTINNSTDARTYEWRILDMQSIFPSDDSSFYSTAFEPNFTISSWGSFSVMLIASSIVLQDTAYKALTLTKPTDIYLDSIVVYEYPATDTSGTNWDPQYYGDPYFVIGDKDASIILNDSLNHKSQMFPLLSSISFDFNSIRLGSIDEYYYLALFDYDNGELSFGSPKDEDYFDDFIFNLTLDISTYLNKRNLPSKILFDYNPDYDIKSEVYISYR